MTLSDTGRDRIAVRAPADRSLLDHVDVDDPVRVSAVVTALRTAQPAWAALGVAGRRQVLARVRDLLLERRGELEDLLAAETGKPLAEVGIELASSLGVLRYYSSHAREFLADETPRPSSLLTALKRMRVRREPYPVVGVISPWNFPVAMCLWDAFPALLAGCAVVVKPSEHTPLTTNLIARIWTEAGAPPVLACVNGAAETGAAVVDTADYVHFTGSTRTGTAIAQRAAGRLVPYSLELGGNDPALVLADADLDLAAAGIVSTGLLNSGQMCVAVERVYVVDEVHDAFVTKLTERVAALRTTGEGYDRDITGPITSAQHEIVARHVIDALDRGARAVVGGRPGPGEPVGPTVLVDVDHSMAVMNEETFGPVLPVMRVADVDDAVRLANDSPYGLSASVWTRDRAAGRRIATRLEAGTVDVNDAATHILCHPIPQAGWKTSGVGARLGGAHGIRKFTRTQAITSNRVDLPLVTALAGFPYSRGKSRLLDGLGRLTDAGGLGRLAPDGASRFTVEVVRTVRAPQGTVFAWLLDSSNYARVLPGVQERRLRDGRTEPYGTGTVREIRSPVATIREELTEVRHPDRIAYRITGSTPPVAHLGAAVVLEPAPGGTRVVWTSMLRGGIVREAVLGNALRAVFTAILAGCARELER